MSDTELCQSDKQLALSSVIQDEQQGTMDEVQETCEPESKLDATNENLWQPITYHFEKITRMTGAWRTFNNHNIASKNGTTCTKGCKWAPDGTCILTNSNDHVLRIFNLPETVYEISKWGVKDNILSPDIQEVVTIKEGGTIYDFCWYPCMTSLDPITCCIASCSRLSPVHLWDAFNGCLRATYNPINSCDEVEAAYSVAFSPDGQKLYCGFQNCLRIFDLARPGRQCEKRSLRGRSMLPHERQPGIVSAIAINPCESKIYAIGSYGKTLGLYGEPDGSLLCLLKAHVGGITHVQFSPDGNKLYTGGRKDPEILCWDLRSPGKLLASFQRTALTHQRIYFDISRDGQYLFSGNTNGFVTIYDASVNQSVMEQSTNVVPVSHSWLAHADCTNGVSLHPTLPIVATSSGQHHFEDDDEENSEKDNIETALVFWWMGEHVEADTNILEDKTDVML